MLSPVRTPPLVVNFPKVTLPDLHNTVSSIGVIMGMMDQDGNMHVRLQMDDDIQIADH